MDEHFMTVLRTEKTFSEKYAELESSRTERLRIAQGSAHDESKTMLKKAQSNMELRAKEVMVSTDAEIKQINVKLEQDIHSLDSLDVETVALKLLKKVMK